HVLNMINASTRWDRRSWDNTPEPTQLEDSIQIMRAFTNQMQRCGSALAGPDLPEALVIIHQRLAPGCEEELPVLMAETIRQLWEYFSIAARPALGERDAILDVI
ncbi:hypothetical protein FRC11_009531, partial [Ceratobasidium sp. 423]